MKILFRKYIYIISIFFFVIVSCDRKQDVLPVNTTNTLLDSLRKDASSSIFSAEGLEKSRILLKEASKQNNDYYMGSAYKYMLLTSLNLQQKDSIDFFAEKAKYYFSKINNDNEMFAIDVCLIEWETQFGNSRIALDKATQLLKNVENNKSREFHTYELISNIYNIIGELQQAESAFLKMLDLKSRYEIKANRQMPYIYLKGAQIETDLGKYEQSLVYCDSAQAYMKKYYNDTNNHSILTLLYLNKSSNFIHLNKLDKAKLALDSLDILSPSRDAYMYNYIQSTWAGYYKKKGDYKKALDYTDSALYSFKETSNWQGYLSTQRQKAQILALKGDFKNAYELGVENKNFSDSIAAVDVQKQLNELQTMYQVDKLQNEAEQNALKFRNTQNTIIFLIIICVLLLVSIFIAVWYSFILKQKNKKLFLHYKEQDELELKKEEERVKFSKNKENSELSLFEKTELYLKESQAYLDSSITRESLALELGTNRQYLTQAIQKNKNMTFVEYINDYRLNYSRRLLIQDTQLSIDDIYIKSGFSNRNTFYRMFKQKYDMSPKEYQKIALKQ